MKAAFSAIVSIVLLVIYVYLVVMGIIVSDCLSDTNCTDWNAGDFNDRMASSLALIGGLVSALVIAELAITKTGEVPAARLLTSTPTGKTKNFMQIITSFYLIVWLLAGLAAFFFGYLQLEPDVLPPLADLGQGWLGIAVGAAYAYFGIKDP